MSASLAAELRRLTNHVEELHFLDITGRLAEISCPALILHGTADAAIPMAKAEALRDGLGGPAELVAIDGGSHSANLSHPDQANAALLKFLRALP